MPEHDFTQIYSQYPAIIAEMPETFTSHEFILKMAHEHQALYVEALYSYRHPHGDKKPTPFMIVHGILAKHMTTFPALIEQTGYVSSKNIFGEGDHSSGWRKIG